MKFKRLVAGSLAGAAVLALGTLLPSEASADTVNGCSSGQFCAWEDTVYSGRIQTYVPATDHAAAYNFGVSSYWNRTGRTMCAYGFNGGGALIIVPGEQTAHLDGGWNDNIGMVAPAGGANNSTC